MIPSSLQNCVAREIRLIKKWRREVGRVHGETKANMPYSLQMMRSCRVTLQDTEGVTHTVEVTAESLYEAVAQGLAALRGREWVAGITNGTVKVSVADVRVEHEVKMTEFTKWLERPGGSPRDDSAAKSSVDIGNARSNLKFRGSNSYPLLARQRFKTLSSVEPSLPDWCP